MARARGSSAGQPDWLNRVANPPLDCCKLQVVMDQRIVIAQLNIQHLHWQLASEMDDARAAAAAGRARGQIGGVADAAARPYGCLG